MKKAFRIKAVSLACSMAMVFSLFNNLNTLPTKATDINSEIKKNEAIETEIFSSDYQTSLKCNGSRSDQFYQTSGDLSPTTEINNTENKVLHYRHSWYGLGIVVLGNDYSISNNNSGAITVGNNMTYAVTLDYKVFGAINSDLDIGIAVTSSTNWKSEKPSQGTFFSQYTSYYENRLNFAKNTKGDGTWNTVTWYVTIPENSDLSKFNNLVIYARNGNQGNDGVTDAGVYFDNIKVKSLAKYSQISSEDYSKISPETDRHSPGWGNFRSNCGDLCAQYDPLDSNNKTLWYRQNCFGFGVLYLGADYSKNQFDDTNTITVEKGKSYVVQFDYLMKGSTTSNPLDIDIGLVNTSLGFNNGNPRDTVLNNSPVVQNVVSIPKNTATDGEWHNISVLITIPVNADLSTYNKLSILSVLGGQSDPTDSSERNGVWYDNVSVYKQDGIALFKDNTLFENDYQNVNVDGYYFVTSGDLKPAIDETDPENKVLYYRQNRYGLGIVNLGNDYSKGNNTDNLIYARKGLTYSVTFDYRAWGTTGCNPLTVGLSVGSANNWPNGVGCNGDGIKTNTAVYTSDFSIDAYSTPDGEWHRKHTAYITVPDDADLSTYNVLQLYANWGNQSEGGIYFDNITVKELAGVNVEYKFEGVSNTVYYSNGKPLDIQTEDDENIITHWYTDVEKTLLFDFDNYVKNEKFETLKLYGKNETINKVSYYLNQWNKVNTLSYDSIKIISQLGDNLVDGTELFKQYYTDTSVLDYMTFDGWYTLIQNPKQKNEYTFGTKITTVDEAISNGGNVYAKWNYTKDTTNNYNINDVYSINLMNSNKYSVQKLDNKNCIKYTQDKYTSGKCSLILADTSDNSSYSKYINENSYAKLNPGTSYKVKFRYKVTDVEEDNPISVCLYSSPISQYWNDSYKNELVKIITNTNKTDDWVDVTTYFTVDSLRKSLADDNSDKTLKSTGFFSDALSLTVFGVGTAYFDDFSVTSLTNENYLSVLDNNNVNFSIDADSNNGIINVDGAGNFIYNKNDSTLELDLNNYQPVIRTFKINDKNVYQNPDLNSKEFKGNDSGNIFVVDYGKNLSKVSMTLFDESSTANGTNFSIVAAEKYSEHNIRYLARYYSLDNNCASYNGAEYDIVEKGVLIKRTQKDSIDCTNMVKGGEKVTTVPCTGDVYNQTELFNDYTVSINNITENYKNTGLYVRGYMTLTDGTNTFNVYTQNVLSTSVNKINDNQIKEIDLNSIIDGDIDLKQSGISTATLTFYESNSSGITYGITWQSLTKDKNPIVQISTSQNGFSIGNYQKVNAVTTDYDRFYKTDGNYNDFTMDKDTTEFMTKYTVYSNKAKISDLQANTTYYYRVGNGTNFSRIGSIKTPDTSNDKFSFLYMTDSQQFYSNVNEWNLTLQKAVKNCNPEFMIHGGDFVNYGAHEKQWTDMLDGNKRYVMNIPIMPAAGNHEYNISSLEMQVGDTLYSHFNVKKADLSEISSAEEDYKSITDTYTGMYYSYDYKNTHFVVLNTNEAYRYNNKLSDTQFEWLTKDLSKAQQNNKIKNTIVYMHCSMYSVGGFGSRAETNIQSLTLRSQLQSTFAKYGVDLVFSGHDHVYSRTNQLDGNGNVVQDGGITYVTGVPAGDQRGMKIFDGSNDDYTKNKDKYNNVAKEYDHCWTEVSVNGTEITVATYSGNTTNGTDKILIDEFTVNNQK